MTTIESQFNPQEQVQATGGKSKVLVIDDEPGIRQLARIFLEKNGYEATLAADGIEGLEKFQPGQFAAVICDRLMPRKIGDEVIPELKKRDSHVKVIMLASGASLIPAEEKARIQADLYVDKPLNFNLLMQQIRQLELRKV